MIMNINSPSADSRNNPRLIGINYNGSSGMSNISSLSNKIILDNFEELPE
tara:strand:- start:462 stop:611 length:150 start_codon:yes stop_codon:yes gene_type:complete